MKILTDQKSKDIPLEALRGIAALVVVLDHSLLAFMPQLMGFGSGVAKNSLQGSIFYLFINGGSAVCLFFVLSGYVLTRRYCASGDTNILVRGAVKRWPRLMGPVLATVLVSYLLFYFHFYYFAQAGARSGSFWLVQFANGFSRIAGPNATVQSIHFRGAIQQGIFLTFFRGDWLFDSSLWTMRAELIGSFIAFGAAPLLLHARKFSTWVTLWLLALLIASLYFQWPELAAFPIGVGLAVLLPRGGVLRPRYAFPALVLALYLLGYPDRPLGDYAIFGFLAAHGLPPTFPQIAGAATLIGTIEVFPPVRRAFSGKFSAVLGNLSFPIYLLHALIICSIASWVYLHVGAIPAIITVFAVTIPAALPLMVFNDWWIAQVNALTDRLLRPGITAPAAIPSSREGAQVSTTPRPPPATKSFEISAE